MQHVITSTHISGNTLDLVISRSTDALVLDTSSTNHGFPDHYPVFAHIDLQKPSLPTHEVSYRRYKAVTGEMLATALESSAVCSPDVRKLGVAELTSLCDRELRKVVDALAPLKHKTITIRPDADWYNSHIRDSKQQRRQIERL